MTTNFSPFILVIAFLLSATCINRASGQEVIALYKDSIPNSKPYPDKERTTYDRDSNLIIHDISRPTLTVFLPAKEKGNGAAVIICPGGGYWVTASKHEGTDVAMRFNEMGVAAFVLKYRMPDENTMINTSIGPLQDAQRAIQIVRENASLWGLDKNRVGIMGFSAGGHLASTAGTHFGQAYIPNKKMINLRPDFMVLVYPVITFMEPVASKGSREKLLGKNASPALIRQFSNELRVTKKTPPAFLVHAKDDNVKVENSILFKEALESNGVPVAMYLYEKGGHGYGMYNKSSTILWMDLVQDWMNKMKFIRNR
ncbi:MAG TPA: alpha/beta hydrolase [Chitinophagaceae bacterium]|jgi:acetyl esterase/lipase|nr:alpha/beta hydrolase [Chitinophagaceae bacterium]